MANGADPISWLLQKPADLDLHVLQRQGISRFSSTNVKKRMSIMPMLDCMRSVAGCNTFYGKKL